jgi:UDP-2-acetamido-2,6-beta-L-arabino-hexul-4-ose reductase
MTVICEPVGILSDIRGLVFEPLPTNQFHIQKNAHVVVSYPGGVRGNHYHLKGEETIAVLGPALVRTREKDAVRDITIPENQAFRLTFPPGISHAIQALGQTPNILIAFNTVEHDPDHPDVVRDVLIVPDGKLEV